MKHIVALGLDNEMDLILAHKRSMKMAELCGLSLPVQTSFATAVSEIARAAMGRKKDITASLQLSVSILNQSKKELLATITCTNNVFDYGQEALAYATKLVDQLKTSESKGKTLIQLFQKINLGGLITDAKLDGFIEYFESEPPLSAYDEIRKKNLQLISLSEKLKASESEYRKLTENLPLMMFTLNALGMISRTNEWFDNYFSGESRNLTGIAWQTFVHSDDLKTLLPQWEKAQIEKQPLNVQARLVQKAHGSSVWHLIKIIPLKDKANNVMEWAGFFVDIHAQKLVEETLKNNEALKAARNELLQKNLELTRQNEFVETILDASVDLISVYDSEKRVVVFNRKCQEIYNVSPEEVIGKKFLEVFPLAAGTKTDTDLDLALSGEYVYNKAFYSTYINRYYENFLIPLRYTGDHVDQVLVIAHDITENVNNEQKLKSTNVQLQRSNYDLEQFAYVASHDLQEPLRKIRNFSELLVKNIEDPEMRKRYIDKIDSSAERMSALIKDVLNYSRLSSAHDPFLPIDLNKVIENIVHDFELLLEEKEGRINFSNLPIVPGVYLQLHQLFSNLVSNAFKFNRNKPVISISSQDLSGPEAIALGLDASKSYACITVKDNGIGFDQKYAEQIFTIFQRLGNRNDYAGTGIGLALCKKIVDKHNGKITVRSEEGVGSEFRVILPL